MSNPSKPGYSGFQQPADAAAEFSAQTFLIRSMLATVRTVALVKVVACTNDGGVSPVGFVDVQPLVNQVDGSGNAVPHGVLYSCPYFRIQGGANAVIIDPQPGDIGMAAFCDRDISKVIATKAQANPGSRRKFDMADGLYIGGMLNGVPSQYVQFSAAGITIHSPTEIDLVAPIVNINAGTSVTITTPIFTVNGNTVLNGTITQGAGGGGGAASLIGPLTVTNNVTAQGTSVHTHVHSGVQSGGSNTGTPV